MTAEKTWTVNAIKDAMRAAGSHWFDPDTMRFFGTKVLPTVYQGPGGVYFITSEQPPHGGRMYSVRQFDPVKATIDTVGEFAGMNRRAAIALASEKSGLEGTAADFGTKTEDYRPVTVLEQFTDDLQKHGQSGHSSGSLAKDASSLIELAKRHHRYMEKLCSDEAFCRQVNEEGEHPRVIDCRKHIVLIARHVGAIEVLFSGDPRGCTVKLVFKDGFTNDFGKEAYCVPTGDDD